jgi:dihydrofolate reductase
VSSLAAAATGRTAPSLPAIPLVLIAAVAENGVIGRANQLPWRLKSDMQHFRSATMNHPVIMGRRTFQSLFKPLQGRTAIVVTRDPTFTAPGAVVAGSLAAALAAAHGDALRRGADAIMVAGGAEIYAQAMPLAQLLLITLVHDQPEGDAVFPAVDRSIWHEVDRVEHAPGPGNSASFAYIRFERANRSAADASRSTEREGRSAGNPSLPRHERAL